MKKLMFVLFAACSLLNLFAADVKVDATGAVAGSHLTIQAAINAAANGDRIVVFSNDLDYAGNLSINKSLTLLCATQEEYFYVTGDISITPANGREITIIGLHQTGNILSASVNPVGARCAVNIVDSKVYGTIIFAHDGFDVNLLYSTVSRTVELRHGKVIANMLGVLKTEGSAVGQLKITAESASYGTGDTVFIIANRITKGDVSLSYVPLIFDNANARYFIANNAIRAGATNTNNTYYTTAVEIISCLLTDSANVFINNYVSAAMDGGTQCALSTANAAAELKGIRTGNLVNNIFRNRYTVHYGCALLNGLRGDYNYYHYYRAQPAAVDFTDNNLVTTYSQTVPDIDFDLETGKVTGGIDGVDGGKPGVTYTDIDLTRADIGTYGGPYSQENYWDAANPQGGRARVFMLDVPSKIYSLTSPTTIRASSTHTK